MTETAGPIRFCPLCKQADSDPRHVISGDDASVAKHMDCCREAGCPDGSCAIVTAGAEDLRGDSLRSHLVSPKNQAKISKAMASRDAESVNFATGTSPVELKGVTQ